MLKKCGYPRLLFLGEERPNYMQGLKRGNEEKYAGMIAVFADLIFDQRYNILAERLREVIVVPIDNRQVRLEEFYSIKSKKKKQ